MRTATPTPPVEFAGIRCSDESISEVRGGQFVQGVRRDEITAMRLVYGTQSPRAGAQRAAGSMLTLIGYFPALHLVHWFRFGGTLIEPEVWLIPFSLLGIWIAVSSFRQGYVLEIQRKHGRAYLAFTANPDPETLRGFLRDVQMRYGLTIERDDQPV